MAVLVSIKNNGSRAKRILYRPNTRKSQTPAAAKRRSAAATQKLTGNNGEELGFVAQRGSRLGLELLGSVASVFAGKSTKC